MIGRRNAKLNAAALAISVPLLAPAIAHAAGTGSAGGGGWGWWDGAIWGGALVGIILLGFFGDLVVGTLIYGAATAPGFVVRLVGRTGRIVKWRAHTLIQERRETEVHPVPVKMTRWTADTNAVGDRRLGG